MMTGILLVLRGVHTGVIGNNDDHAGVDAGVGCRKQRITGDVQTDVLHTAEAALAGHSGAECDFHGNLFVRRPFAVDLIVFCGFFCNLSARRTRIAGSYTAAGLIQTAGNCLVAQHELFHK